MAVLEGRSTRAIRLHTDGSDYSGWLLPAVEEALTEAHAKMERVNLLAVATGPGSFTGLRVGLSTVKAWAEVYRKPVVGVSRLEAMARTAGAVDSVVASCYDAQRGQLFGAVYRSSGTLLSRVGEEQVIGPEDFVESVYREAASCPVTWITLDPELIRGTKALRARSHGEDSIIACAPELAQWIGLLAEERAQHGEFSDPLTLDANYVRRSDAEIFWKGPASDVH